MPKDRQPGPAPPTLEIRNRLAAFGWGFMGVWLGMLALLTWTMARDGPHPSQPAWLQLGALAAFWLVGLPAAGYLLSRPVTRLRVAPDGTAVLGRRTPFGREEERYPPGSITAVEVREGKDSDGDPYWRTFLVVADGRQRVVREGHHAPEQKALAARLRGALALAESRSPT